MDLSWEARGKDVGDRAMSIASAIAGTAQELVRQQMGDLEESFPFNRNFHFHAHFDQGAWFGLRLIFVPRLAMMVGPRMEESDIAYLKSKIEPFEVREPEEIRSRLGSNWLDVDRFTYVGPYQDNRVSWQDIEQHLLWWLNNVVVPSVLERNRLRVLRAIPQPPNYDLKLLADSVWVLECELDCRQGTAFALEGSGLVSCAHVLGTGTKAFRFDRPSEKYPVTVLARHDVVDLAILSIPCELSVQMKRGDPTQTKQMDHILVVGHPNYRYGDSPLVVPGLVVGFRNKSGIRRFLTNAAIVAGGSGGPVVNRLGQVIGVAVTGADRFDKLAETEDLGVVPIDALDLLEVEPR